MFCNSTVKGIPISSFKTFALWDIEEMGFYKRIFEVCPAQNLVCFLTFWAVVQEFSLRNVLPICLVAMTGSPPDTQDNPSTCTNLYKLEIRKNETTNVTFSYPFHWNQKMQGQLLAAYFYGFTASQLIAGILAVLVKAKWLAGVGILFSGALSVASPATANYSYTVFLAVRAIIGLFSGLVFPSCVSLLSSWTTPRNRALFMSITYAGITAGSTIVQVSSGYLISTYRHVLGGWPLPFYVFGGIVFLWFLFWCIFVFETPSQHPGISSMELRELTTSGEQGHKKSLAFYSSVPWISILTAVPFWALTATIFGHHWGLDLFGTQLPNFLKNIIHLDIEKVGLYTALTSVVSFVCSILAGFTSRFIQCKSSISINKLRKVFTCFAFYGGAVIFLGWSFSGCNEWLNIIVICTAAGVFGFQSAGVQCTYLDLAPAYSSVIYGLSNTLCVTAGVIGPIAGSYFLGKGETTENWRYCLLLACGIFIFSCTIFMLFGSSDKQSWAEVKHKCDSEHVTVNSPD